MYCSLVGDSRRPVCQYNEDCPPDKLCDRLNRVCINPCSEDSCGDNAECVPTNHGISCSCLPGHQGNAYIECEQGRETVNTVQYNISGRKPSGEGKCIEHTKQQVYILCY